MKQKKKQKPLEIWKPGDINEHLENILRLQVENPRAYMVLSPGLKIAAGRYAELRAKQFESPEAA
jgi:hypothetical protein